MAELKLTNNPCKYCNGEIDEGKPLCGDIVNDGDVVNIVNFQIDICPECLQKLLVDNVLPPLYYEEKEKTNDQAPV